MAASRLTGRGLRRVSAASCSITQALSGRSDVTKSVSRRWRAARLLHRELQYRRGWPGPSSGTTGPWHTGQVWAVLAPLLALLDARPSITLPREMQKVSATLEN